MENNRRVTIETVPAYRYILREENGDFVTCGGLYHTRVEAVEAAAADLEYKVVEL
jgi:hypothetical protein